MPALPRPLLGHPWAITQGGLELVIAVASRDEFFADVRKQALMARDATPLENTHAAEIRDGGVAVLRVKGPLFRYASMFSSVSAATSYGELRKDFQKCLEDDAVKAIIFDVDSPGGEVNGCAELADAIYAARGRKPMCSYVSGTGASAAYWIASSAGDIYLDSTADVGSIGCKYVLVDDHDAQKEEGRRRIEIVSSQSPGKASDPHDDGYQARLQQRCDDMAGVFIRAVARNRGVTPEFVRAEYGKGDVMVGARAVEAGLADQLSNFEAVLADVAGRLRISSNTPIPGAQMADYKTMAKLAKLDDGASEREVEDRVQSLAAFERAVFAATGSTDGDAAVGKVCAGVEAIVERDRIKVEIAAKAEDDSRREFRSLLKGAIKEGRLTLGQLVKVVPTFLKEEEGERAAAAMAAVDKQDRKQLLDAMCTASVGPKAVARVRAFIESQPAQVLPAAHKAPPLDEANREQVTKVSQEEASKFGLRAESVDKYRNIHSVADIHAAAQKGQ